ncbi:MAG: DUF4054 domain-containing protein [candidate division FCPU426 bacterium]
MPTPQEIIADRAPGFTITDRVNNLVAQAQGRTSTTAFKHVTHDNTSLAVALLVLHQLTLEQRGAGKNGSPGAGGITDMREGGLAVSFGEPRGIQNLSAYKAWLMSTSFGQELLALQAENISGLPARGQFCGAY